MPNPDFLCIGTQKSGTTWLFENLVKHPDVWTPPVKEMHYFNRMCLNNDLLGYWNMPHPGGFFDRYRAGLLPPKLNTIRWIKNYYDYGLSKNWYRNLFDEVYTQGKVCGDITPGYCTLEERGVKYVQDVIGQDTPVIFIVRNPIERSWSAAKMMFRYRKIEVSEKNGKALAEILQHPSITLCSEYTRIINLWRKYFANFHVLTYDELCADPKKFLAKVSEYIRISDQWDQATIAQRFWSDKHKTAIPPAIQTLLEQQYRGEIESTAKLLQDRYVDQW